MRTNYLIIIALFSGSFLGYVCMKHDAQIINPIIGDASMEHLLGTTDANSIDESARILIHLAYVEKILRERTTEHLSSAQKKNRVRSLDLLHEYWMKRSFPSNYDYPNERKPCFRDKNGQICAVGYLVQQSGNEALVKEIEANQNYAYLKDMTSENLRAWLDQSGLSAEECAMIQPTYGPIQSYDSRYIPRGHAIASSTLTGLSLTASMISYSQISNRTKNSWIVPAIGIGSGIAQITLGSLNYGKTYSYGWSTPGYEVYYRNDNLSLFNIGFGTFTTAFNAYVFARQLRNRKNNNNLSLSLYSFQNPNSEVNVGFNLIKRL